MNAAAFTDAHQITDLSKWHAKPSTVHLVGRN